MVVAYDRPVFVMPIRVANEGIEGEIAGEGLKCTKSELTAPVGSQNRLNRIQVVAQNWSLLCHGVIRIPCGK